MLESHREDLHHALSHLEGERSRRGQAAMVERADALDACAWRRCTRRSTSSAPHTGRDDEPAAGWRVPWPRLALAWYAGAIESRVGSKAYPTWQRPRSLMPHRVAISSRVVDH